MAKATGAKIHMGSLMVIASIKGHEKPASEWIVKAGTVFAMQLEMREARQLSLMRSLRQLQLAQLDCR